MNVGGEECEVGIVAAVEREFHHLLRVDDLAFFAAVGLEGGSGSFDVDHLCGLANSHGDFDALAGAYIYIDAGGLELLEAGEFTGNGVGADFDIEKVVVAIFIGGGFHLRGGFGVGQGDLRLGNDGSCGVVDSSEDLGSFELRPGWRGEEER